MQNPDAETPKRPCERCGADMAFLAELPRLNMFRCMQCDNVVSEEVD
jgi:hypothetical protein